MPPERRAVAAHHARARGNAGGAAPRRSRSRVASADRGTGCVWPGWFARERARVSFWGAVGESDRNAQPFLRGLVRADMTREDQLCLLLARGQLSLAARRRALELLASPLRWDLLLARAGAECCMVRKQQRLSYVLELHWKLLSASSRNAEAVDGVWAEARPKTFFGVPARTLSPEWELLFLAVHAASHKWMTLKWLIDIDQLCVSGLIDWQKVKEKADRLELYPVVNATLGACSSLLETPLQASFDGAALPASVQLFPASPSYLQ